MVYNPQHPIDGVFTEVDDFVDFSEATNTNHTLKHSVLIWDFLSLIELHYFNVESLTGITNHRSRRPGQILTSTSIEHISNFRKQ